MLGVLCITLLVVLAPKYAERYPVVYAIALVLPLGISIVWYHRRYFQNEWLDRLGVRRLRSPWQIIVLTIAFYGITELWELLFPSVSSGLSKSSFIEMFVIGVFLGPIVEEMVFRQLLYFTLIQWLKKPIFVAVITSLMFSFVHFTSEIHTYIEIFVAGLFYSYLRLRYDTILAPMASHMLHNGIIVLGIQLGL